MDKKLERIVKANTTKKAEELCYRTDDGKLIVISGVHGVIVDDDPTVTCMATGDWGMQKRIQEMLCYGDKAIDIDKKAIKEEIKRRGCKRSKLDNTLYELEYGCAVNIYYLLDVMDAIEGFAVYIDTKSIQRDKSGKHYCSGIAVDGHKGKGFICPIKY